jgi:beta-mannosidase
MSENPTKLITRRELLEMAATTAIAMQLPAEAHALVSPPPAPQAAAPSPSAKLTYDLSQLPWKLYSFEPFIENALAQLTDYAQSTDAEIRGIPAPVPGSVQLALLNAGVIKDWNVALNARDCEWVENRDWVYQTAIPDEWIKDAGQIRLHCAGLDYTGSVMLNGQVVKPFKGSFIPYSFDLKPHLKPSGNLLQILFTPPPRWLGEFGYCSRMTEWKVRFNYYWDWISRLVQCGIWGEINLQVIRGAEIAIWRSTSDADLATGKGILNLSGSVRGGGTLRIRLSQGDRTIREASLDASAFQQGLRWNDLPIELWWPNGMGAQPLYDLTCELLDREGRSVELQSRRVGFRHIEWRRTKNAAPSADPFLCVANGRELFLFGVNWTPIRPNFADLKEQDYTKRLDVYRDCAMNVMRVWGGGFLEKEWFYNGCDERGLLVWQEFPLSSSSIDNYPPGDPATVEAMGAIAESYIALRQHHASLLLWCGGNELSDNRIHPDDPTAVTLAHPVMARFAQLVARDDPSRRFYITAPYGPEINFTPQNCGKGIIWDTHGPYDVDGPMGPSGISWKHLWEIDDAMFHSELGVPSASSAALIRRYKGDLPEMPATHDNPLWNRQPWWINWNQFAVEKGREPRNLEEFVDWSQARQAAGLAMAARMLLARYPACGGMILWMGHDAFPCTANTSIVDFDGNPKPAAIELGKIFRSRT